MRVGGEAVKSHRLTQDEEGPLKWLDTTGARQLEGDSSLDLIAFHTFLSPIHTLTHSTHSLPCH